MKKLSQLYLITIINVFLSVNAAEYNTDDDMFSKPPNKNASIIELLLSPSSLNNSNTSNPTSEFNFDAEKSEEESEKLIPVQPIQSDNIAKNARNNEDCNDDDNKVKKSKSDPVEKGNKGNWMKKFRKKITNPNSKNNK